MSQLLIFLFVACVFLGYGQTSSPDPQDVVQQSAEYLLKGLPAVKICGAHLEDYVKRYSLGALTLEQLYEELEVVLKRYHVPLAPIAQRRNCIVKDNTGIIMLLSRIIGYPGDAATILTLRLEVSEGSVLKRDSSRTATVIDWDDEQEIDSPATNARYQFLEAVDQLGQRFALAYLAANK